MTPTIPAGMVSYGPEHPDYPNAPDEKLAELTYRTGYEWFRNKWIGDHAEMCADLVRAFVPRSAIEGLGDVEDAMPTSTLSDDVAGLIERLRARTPTRSSYLYGTEGGDLINPDGPEAADALLRLSSARGEG